ncbi:MAG: 50S ribosomal protein L29 [Halobacteriovoraceae bacterium]|nr:50S ribosomal protein L29 [Halobacteriovoraceae bacterium]
MKALDKAQIKSFDEKTIDKNIAERRNALFRLRMKKGASTLEKPHIVKTIKKDIARLLTAKNNKQEKK